MQFAALIEEYGYVEKQAFGEKLDFDGATEANACRLLAEVSLSEERFQEVIAIMFEAISCVVIETTSFPDEDGQHNVEDVDFLNNGSHQAAINVAGKQKCLVQHYLDVKDDFKPTGIVKRLKKSSETD
ncbi:hypothetical protein CTI12_AA459260 [Artemisia annua]|uniref:GDPGP1-like C-terminal domain-containing protein n=1 Tax=Artemisia annua TaxID=35608 RepID=A0A2U1LSM1_ARTAN|nr:hypothetical protein CTI12_AA459260 [Artemisia annua]